MFFIFEHMLYFILVIYLLLVSVNSILVDFSYLLMFEFVIDVLIFEAREKEMIGYLCVCGRGIPVGIFGIEGDFLRRFDVRLERILLIGGVCFIIGALLVFRSRRIQMAKSLYDFSCDSIEQINGLHFSSFSLTHLSLPILVFIFI